jgi:hypothetical protein
MTSFPPCRLTKSTSVRSAAPLDQDAARNEELSASSRLSVGPQRVMMAPQRVPTTDSNSTSKVIAVNERPPLRVQRTTAGLAPPPVQSSADHPQAESVRSSVPKFDKEKTSELVLQSSVTTPSLNEIKALITDPLWSNRSV